MSDDELQFRGGGLNPLNWVDRLAQYRYQDPDAPSARDVHDPHVWDDPDPSLRERLTPDTIAGWFIGAIVTLVFGGLAFYLIPIFAPTFRNPWFLALCLFAAYTIGIWMHGRISGYRTYQRLVKSILYLGNEIDVRAGEDAGTDGRSKLFTPYRSLKWGGLVKRALKKRDLPYSAEKLRSNMGKKDEIGEEPVVDRLNQTTLTAETETLGTFHVTWADDLEYDTFGVASDRYTTRPSRLDEDVADDMNQLIESLESAITTLRQQKAMLEERGADLRMTRSETQLPELQQTVELMKEMYELQPDRAQRRETPDPTLNGNHRSRPSVSQQLWREVEEEVSDR